MEKIKQKEMTMCSKCRKWKENNELTNYVFKGGATNIVDKFKGQIVDKEVLLCDDCEKKLNEGKIKI